MGRKFRRWVPRSGGDARPETPDSVDALQRLLLANRHFDPVTELRYGDHGLERAVDVIYAAMQAGKRIALYADYDVDGTMSCVSWIWFFEAAGFKNYVHYIPCRFKEGYGLNLAAVKHLIDDEKAELVLTMDTGITANEEAAYCRSRGVEFVCTDHHVIQPDKMPDCVVLNPKMHPDPHYQELCGCGITFVALRRLAERLKLDPEKTRPLWTDLLALAGMATICDVVPLNPVNHRLARLGVDAIAKSKRPVLRVLREAASLQEKVDESSVGFRLGPRINAVGRMAHADLVVRAFVDNDPGPLVEAMGECNEERKRIQRSIVADAMAQGAREDGPVLFLGGDWHSGVVGIAASKIAEHFWKPTWLFQRKEGICKGSARTIPGFDVTAAMGAAKDLFKKFGGHKAAGGFTFAEENEGAIRERLREYALDAQKSDATLWESRAEYDCVLDASLCTLNAAAPMERLRPFGQGFPEPVFRFSGDIVRADFLKDKQTGEPRHTAVTVALGSGRAVRVLFFSEVFHELHQWKSASFLGRFSINEFRGERKLEMFGVDFASPLEN
jgi:single-stranded-DNA-specific exonuclease